MSFFFVSFFFVPFPQTALAEWILVGLFDPGFPVTDSCVILLHVILLRAISPSSFS